MDTKKIIENGYDKLAEKLPDWKKGILAGMEYISQDIENFEYEYQDTEDSTILDKMYNEVAREVIAEFKEWLENEYREHLIAFVDDNPYCIDENGEVVKDE